MSEGLKIKYDVFKVSDGSIVNNCFVLRPEKDLAAVAALRSYAAATDNKTLAEDIIRWVGPIPNPPLTPYDLRERIGKPIYSPKCGWGIIGEKGCENDCGSRLVIWFPYGWEWADDVLRCGSIYDHFQERDT